MENIRVLIVEDESIIAQDLRMRLQRMGYGALGPVLSGEMAVELARKERPDVILMDIALTGRMDGIEAAGIIKKELNIPVIYVTAYSDDKVLDRAKHTSPYGYLIKPFVERELKATIETAMYKHRVEEELRRSREQYQALLEASGAVPWEMEASTMRFTYVGPQCQSVLKLDPRELSTLTAWLEKIHPDDRRHVKGIFNEAAACAGSNEIEYRVTHSDDRVLWIHDTISSAAAPGGGLMIRGYMLDVTARKEAELERQRYISELRDALDRIKTLHGLLPICAWCKKIRDDKGYWQQVEVYVKDHSEAEFTHSICPDCRKAVEEEERKGK